MASVFLSYAREDFSIARSLAGALERVGHSVWWDRHIKGASQFAAEIEAALAKAEAVIVLWSEQSVGSPWVRDEASAARDSGRLVPASIDGTQPPMGFRQYQSVDLSGWKGRRSSKRFSALVEALDGVLAGGGPREVAQPAATTSSSGKHLRWWMAAVAAALIVATATAIFLYRAGPSSSGQVAIGLLPIAEGTRDPATRELALATRDSLSQTLSDGGFPVSLVADAHSGGGPATGLLLSGSVQRDGESAKATIRIEETAQRVIVYSHQFEAGGDDVKLLPERIGAQVAAALSWAGPLMAIDRRQHSDPAITSELLRQMTLIVEGGDPLRAYEIARKIAPRAPQSAIAQLSLAITTAGALDQLPRDQRAAAVATARRASERAKALAPKFGDVHVPWCLLHSPVRLVECENRLRAAMRADPEAPFVSFFLSGYLANAGRSGEALELARLAIANDRYKMWKIARLLRTLEAEGHSGEAERLFREGDRWWPNHEILIWNRWVGMLTRGNFDGIVRFEKGISLDVMPLEDRTPADVLRAIRTGNATAANKLCTAPTAPYLTCFVGLGHLGELDNAFAIADVIYPRLRSRTPAEEERLWLDIIETAPLSFLSSPALARLRRDPRFLVVAERVGLLDYWRRGRLPDFCKVRPEPVCAKLSRPAGQ